MDFDITPTNDDALGDSAGCDAGVPEPYTVPDVPEFGVNQVQAYDWDGDGINDSLVGYLDGVGAFDATDLDQDGDFDYLAIDTDGDGAYDVLILADGDTGNYLIQWDSDNDGTLDQGQMVTGADIAEASPQLWNLINEHYTPLDLPVAPEIWYPEVQEGCIVGDPFQYSDEWFEQSFNGSCVPASVAQIYNLYTGGNVSDLDFVELANQLGGAGGSTGWIVGPDGAPGLPADAAALMLEAAGIPATTTYGSMDTLAEALAEGNAVMVAFDSGEVWYGEEVEDNTADHMAVVAAIDYDAGLVYLSDTGNPDGNMEAVPIEVFIDAWEDSNFLMVECTQSVTEFQEANGIAVGSAAEAPADGHGAGLVAEDTIVHATSHQWALLPISGTTLAEAAAAHRQA